jgi:hypothetical protein
MRIKATQWKKTPEQYIAWAGVNQAYTNANSILGQAQESGFVSTFWTQVKNICMKRLELK